MTSTRNHFANSGIFLEAVAVVAAAVFFTIYMTYPLPQQIGTHLMELADSRFSTYVHAWVAHSLLTHPSQLWNMNFLYPAKNTLACSENWIGDQLLFAPVYLLTGNPVAAHNFVILASFVLCSLTMYLLVRWLTGNVWAASIAGFIYAFAFPRLSALGHMQLLNTQWIPLLVLFLFAFFRTKHVGALIALCCCVILQILCSLYLGYMAILIATCYFIALAIANRELLTRTELRRLAIGAVVTGLLLLPVVVPYLQQEKAGTIDVVLEDETTIRASASPIATYLEVKGWPAHPYAGLLDRFDSTDYRWEKDCFMGFLAMGLALVGVFYLRRLCSGSPTVLETATSDGLPGTRGKGRPDLWLAAIYGSIMTVVSAYVISLGPFLRIDDRITSIRLPFYFLRKVVPGFEAFRVPARFGFAVLFGLSVLAAFGFLYVLQWQKKKANLARGLIGAGLAIACLAFMSYEYRVAPYKPFPVMVPSNISPEYQWLAKQPGGSPIVELPITGGPYFPNPQEQSAYLFASIYHWQPLINGYTSHRPQLVNSTYKLALDLPSAEAASILWTLGVRYVVVHADMMSPSQLQTWSAPHPGISEVEDFGKARIYRLDAPPCASGFGDIAMKLLTAQIAGPGDKFGFQILSEDLKQCWVDTTPGPKQLIAEWSDSSGKSEIAKIQISPPSIPLYS